MTMREWESPTPWRKLAEIAKRAAHDAQLQHSKQWEAGLIHASAGDFEDAFELPVKIMIAEAELRIIILHAQMSYPGFGGEAIRKQDEINKLNFEMAKRERPDAT